MQLSNNIGSTYACAIRPCDRRFTTKEEAEACSRENHLDTVGGMAIALHHAVCRAEHGPGPDDCHFFLDEDKQWPEEMKEWQTLAQQVMDAATGRTFHGMTYFDAVRFALSLAPQLQFRR